MVTTASEQLNRECLSRGRCTRNGLKQYQALPFIVILCILLFGVLSPVSVESSSVPDISTQSNTIPPPQQGRHQNTGLHRAGPVEDSNDEFEKEIPINSNDSKLPSPRIKSSPISPPSHHIPSASASSSSSSSIAPRSLQTATASMKSAELDQDKSKSLLEKNGDDDDEEDNSRTNPRTLMLIRLLFITYYGSLGSLMPYLPVYYHSLGHGGQAIGMLGAVKPLTTFIVAPLWGVISDYSQNPSLILQLTFLASLVLQLMIPLKDEVHYLMGMVFLTALFNAPVKSLIDGMVMNKLSPVDRGQYGKLRLWGQLGFGLGSSIVGATISRSTSTSSATMAENAMNTKIQKSAIETMKAFISNPLELISNLQGYQLAFLAYALMSIPSFIAVQSFRNAGHDTQNVDKAKKITKTDTSPKISEGIKMLLHNGDALLFFSLVLVVGITSGIIENFAYVRLREVGGSGKEMGLCRLVSSLCGAPMFWFSGPLTAKLGADRVLVLSLLSYVFRFLNYALMKHPFHALPAEGMRGIAFAAFWSTGTIFAHKISPPGMSVTMLMFMNAMYGGLGQSTGAIIGGKLQSKFGTTKTFLYSALVDFIFVCFVSIYMSFRPSSSFKDPKPIIPPTKKED